MSKLTLASRPATISMPTSPLSGTTIGRFERSCGAIGTSAQPEMPGCRIGPPADSAYAVEPVGELTIRPSARHLGDEVAVDLDAQLDHAGARAAADDDVVEREALEDARAVALDVALEHGALLVLEIAGQDGCERALVLAQADVGDEAQAPLVDADERRAVAGELAGDAEHGAVTADDDGDVARFAERARGEPGVGVDAGVGGGAFLERHRQAVADQEGGHRLELFADALGVELADQRSVPEAGRHSRDYTTATPADAGRIGLQPACDPMLDERAKTLLKALVERYIADGQPVGSRTLSRASGLELSPATIRNVMADLEELGLIASPHTSAGRIPTARGYRLFVDTMLTARPHQLPHAGEPRIEAQLSADQPQRVIANAAQLLSSLSSFVGVITAPKKTSVFHHIEFMRLSERRVLVILVAPDGDVQNRVIFTAQDYTSTQLLEASNFLTSHYAGLTLEEVRERLKTRGRRACAARSPR